MKAVLTELYPTSRYTVMLSDDPTSPSPALEIKGSAEHLANALSAIRGLTATAVYEDSTCLWRRNSGWTIEGWKSVVKEWASLICAKTIVSDSFLEQAYKDKLNVPEALSRLFDKRTPSNATVAFLSDNNISLSSHKMRITSLDVHSKEERECTLRTQFVAKRYKEKEGVGILQNMWQ